MGIIYSVPLIILSGVVTLAEQWHWNSFLKNALSQLYIGNFDEVDVYLSPRSAALFRVQATSVRGKWRQVMRTL